MPRFETDPDALARTRALGEALAALRRERGLSQAEAGRRLGMTSQGWGLYESGRRPGLHRPDVQRRLLAALDATPEALALRLDETAPPSGTPETPVATGLQSAGRGYSPPAAPDRERLTLTDDALSPWAASGVVLEYAPGRWPRRDQGCVIDLEDGERLVRLYVGADADDVSVRGGPEGLDVVTQLSRRRIARLSAVIARLEHE